MLPIYLEQLTLREIEQRAEQLYNRLSNCTICPHNCKKDRIRGQIGVCRSTSDVFISSYAPHFGEEPPLVGSFGSGTIFFTNCNLCCQFCQNYDISHLKAGRKITIDELAQIMLNLQQRGCHNINFVTPTHYTPQIVQSLILAIERGLEIPLVYNCGGYESVETLKLLEGIIDIYMPDVKYSKNENARKYSGADNYWEIVTNAVKEMHRQVGDLKINWRGIAQRGLLIRHLVLPNDVAGSKTIIDFVAKEISPNTYLNIMEQYRPTFKAYKYEELNRRITNKEYSDVINYATQLGVTRGLE